MSWEQWFVGRDVNRVGYAEVFHEAARRALREHHCTVGWLPSCAVVNDPALGPVNGLAQPLLKRVYVPAPESIGDLCVVLHEVGHIARGLAKTELESEAAANAWAWSYWFRHELPYAEVARFSFAGMLERTIRRELAAGTVTAAAAIKTIPDELRADVKVEALAVL